LFDAAARTRFVETLQAGAAALGIALSAEQVGRFLRFTERLLDANTRTNLTRIVEPGAIAAKHFVDSLAVFSVCPDLAHGASVADVGTGAGFPGVPLQILRPDLRLVLMDALGKRIAFLGSLVDDLALENVSLVHARAEEAGRLPEHRDRHDLVVARAVAALPTLLEWCGPLVRPRGGRFVAMKTPEIEDELAGAARAARALGLRLARDLSVEIPAPPGDTEPLFARRLLVWEKERPTPPAFPRRTAQIKARPL
jgi:16S rRNA (guanine527-N7)-methyltransferase